MPRADRFLHFAGAALVVLYFFGLVRPSLGAYFDPDDMMNLYRSWSHPLSELVKANVLFFWASPFYRPVPSVWYRAVFHFSGFNPFPFHASYLVILFVDLGVTYSVYRRLSDSREIALVATFLGSYYQRINFIYFDTSYVYDTLCYTFYFSAFLLYLRVRQRERWPRLGELAACSILYICALNSKEMAVTLPFLLLSYELVFHPPRSWRAAGIGQWLGREGRGALVTGAITLVFLTGRLTGAESLAANPAYRPLITWTRFMETSRHFLTELIPGRIAWNDAKVLALWGVLLLIAWAAKSRVLRFAWLSLMFSPLPVAFIPPRGLAQYYIPWFAWVLYAGTVLVLSLAWLTRRVVATVQFDPVPFERVRGPLVVAGLALILYPHYRHEGWDNVDSVAREGPIIRGVAEQLRTLYPRFPPGSRLLLLDDPLRPERYDPVFIVRLLYRDDSLAVDRAKAMPAQPDEAHLASYDHVFDYRGGAIFEVQRPWRRSAAPLIVQVSGHAQVFHQGWKPVTAESPAKAGEVVISQVMDLGATDPPVPSGRPFPREPLLPVAAAIEVRVNGKPAEVVLRIGWPEQVNLYRVDFRIPPGTAPGEAAVGITAGGITGPLVRMPAGG